MGRWKPDARERLRKAALDLFSEQGFAVTTVPQITERAGLTTRTFYRHFADKRDVVFLHQDAYTEMRAVLAQAPAELDTAAFLTWGLGLLAASVDGQYRFNERQMYYQLRPIAIAFAAEDGPFAVRRVLYYCTCLCRLFRRGRGFGQWRAGLNRRHQGLS